MAGIHQALLKKLNFYIVTYSPYFKAHRSKSSLKPGESMTEKSSDSKGGTLNTWRIVTKTNQSAQSFLRMWKKDLEGDASYDREEEPLRGTEA